MKSFFSRKSFLFWDSFALCLKNNYFCHIVMPVNRSLANIQITYPAKYYLLLAGNVLIYIVIGVRRGAVTM